MIALYGLNVSRQSNPQEISSCLRSSTVQAAAAHLQRNSATPEMVTVTVALGVNAFAEEFGDEAAAGRISHPFVDDGKLSRNHEAPAVTSEEAGDWLPDGYWCVDEGDERVKDFPPVENL